MFCNVNMPVNEMKFFPSPAPTGKMKKEHPLISFITIRPKIQNSISNQEAIINPHSPKSSDNSLNNKVKRQE